MMMVRGLHRLVRLPFSVRCNSESSVALAVPSATAAALSLQPPQSNTSEEKGGKDNNTKMNKTQTQPSFTRGLHRIIRRFKTFSQLFVYKEKMEEVEKEMEIGLPTDVKHVAHIGTDTMNQVSNWEILSFPSISLQQFEVAMAAQSHAPPSATIY